MRDNLHDYRKSYSKGSFNLEDADENPMQQFQKWFYDVKNAGGVDEVNAMTLTTIGKDGYPRGRVVLLKKYDEHGFYFYTNYNSEKGASIAYNPNVCISFFWPNIERQIIIKGKASKISREVSQAYFASRPKGSQIGALVSPQSSVILNRKVLEAQLKAFEKQYENTEVPMPADWGGYVIAPHEFEFWQGRPNRLHDRIRYSISGIDWKLERLAP